MENKKRLIDANALLEKLSRMIDYCENDNKVNGLTALFQVGDAVMDLPTIDAVEVVHGRWEMGVDEGDYEYGTCSVCGYNEYNAFCCLLPHNYCPNCGAKMDGERKGNAEQRIPRIA